MKHIAGNTYTTKIGYTAIGIYMDGNSAILIDTGSEEKASLLTLLESHHLTPRAIINTHLHIDHIGCNKLLQEKFECPAYCPIEEIEDARYDAGVVSPNTPDGPCTTIPLPGHSVAHQGVVTPDGVCFVGDAIMSVRSKLPYGIQEITHSGIAVDPHPFGEQRMTVRICRIVLRPVVLLRSYNH